MNCARWARTPPGQWMVSNFDNLLQGGDLSREELDGISTNHPIFVWYTNGHDACVNSLALKITSIPDNIGVLPGGGHFGRDERGQLNGLVYEESAMKKVLLPALPKITPQLAVKAVSDYLRSVAAVGNTTVHEPGTLRSDWIPSFAKLSNRLACRTSASLMYDDMKGIGFIGSLGLGAKADAVAELTVLSLRHQDCWRRVEIRLRRALKRCPISTRITTVRQITTRRR